MRRRIAIAKDQDVSGKKVLLRVDINCPISRDGKILDDYRIRIHSSTVRRLIEENAAVVILAHQGRPGMDDFIDLSQHSTIMSRIVGTDIQFVDDIIGPESISRIKKLEPGEALMLDNVRFLAEESIEASGEFHAKSYLVRKLAPHFNFFINDAFATAHRKHASMVGFPFVLPSFAGDIMEKEVLALSSIKDPSISPKVFVLGGAKLSDSIRILKNILSNSKESIVLLTGLISELFYLSAGKYLGKSSKEKLEKAGALALIGNVRELYLKYRDRIYLPVDYVLEDGSMISVGSNRADEKQIKDIGPETVNFYEDIMREGKIIVIRGPAGVIEEKEFRNGTISLMRAALRGNAKVIIGGGHLSSLLDDLPEEERRKAHNSTGGGALLLFLGGEDLPAIDALSSSAERFNLSGIELP
ncbi:MAG: phosphoglycerate kinase, partial [Fervidicoccaceae archaeon]